MGRSEDGLTRDDVDKAWSDKHYGTAAPDSDEETVREELLEMAGELEQKRRQLKRLEGDISRQRKRVASLTEDDAEGRLGDESEKLRKSEQDRDALRDEIPTLNRALAERLETELDYRVSG